MKFFLDTASIEQINRWKRYGLVDGITTNPTLLSREGGDPLAHLTRIIKIVDGPVSAQVTKESVDGMIAQGQALSLLGDNVVIKVPATLAGFEAALELTRQGIDCNITLTFHPCQALPFLKFNVAYISLINGRVEDFGIDPVGRIAETRNLIRNMECSTKLLVASLRDPIQLLEAATDGADVITIPPSTWESVFANPLTSSGENDFKSMWHLLPEKVRETYEQIGCKQ